MDDSLEYKISVETTCQSEAKLLRGKIKTKRFMLGAHYETTLKMKNVGEKDFPGGKAQIQIMYASPQNHSINFNIPEIRKGEEGPPIKFSRAAMGKGYASFFGKITSADGERVKIMRYGQELPEGASFYDIFIETRMEVHNYYMLIISAVALLVLAILSLLHLISFWVK